MRRELVVEETTFRYYTARTVNHLAGEPDSATLDLRLPVGALDHSAGDGLFVVGAIRDPHPEDGATRPTNLDGRIVSLIPIHWYGQGEPIVALVDAGECPQELAVRRDECLNCSPDDCATGCCQWQDEDCSEDGAHMTCSRQHECAAECCGAAATPPSPPRSSAAPGEAAGLHSGI